jgi:hypothetical protein
MLPSNSPTPAASLDWILPGERPEMRALAHIRDRDLSHAPDHILDKPLALGWQLVGAAEAFALQFGLSNLGAIDLPPVVDTAADRSHLQTIASLYLAAELEAAQVVPSVELLTGVFANGGLNTNLGQTAHQLHKFWRGRQQRFTPGERQALFARLFGTASGPTLVLPGPQSGQDGAAANAPFEGLMINLAEALFQSQSGLLPGGRPILPGTYTDETPIRTAAQQLAANLLPRTGGVATLAARDLMGLLRDSIAILKQPAVQRAVRAQGVWETVRAIMQLYGRVAASVVPHVERGRSGMLMLTWLAEILPELDAPTRRLLDPQHAAVSAAAGAWLQASLSLYETQPAAGTSRA